MQLNYFNFSDLPGRKNNLPALDARRAWKSLSPKTDTDDLNSFKSSSEKKNNLFVIHCSRNSYMEWHRFAKITPPKSPRGDKNSRCLAEFENSDLLACPIFPQCQPKVDKKLNLRLKKHLRRDILLRLYICAEASSS